MEELKRAMKQSNRKGGTRTEQVRTTHTSGLSLVPYSLPGVLGDKNVEGADSAFEERMHLYSAWVTQSVKILQFRYLHVISLMQK